MNHAQIAANILRSRYNGFTFAQWAEGGVSFRLIIMAFDMEIYEDEPSQLAEEKRLERTVYSVCMREKIKLTRGDPSRRAELVRETHSTCDSLVVEARNWLDRRYDGVTRPVMEASLRYNAARSSDSFARQLTLQLGLSFIDKVYGLRSTDIPEERIEQKNLLSREAYRECETVLMGHVREKFM